MITQTAAPATVAAPENLSSEARLMQLIGGSFVSQAVYVAAKLDLAGLLAQQPQTVKYLAEKTATHERSLYRLLRTLASVGAFREIEDKVFANTPIAETLRSDTAESLRDMAIWMGEAAHWRVFGEMLTSVKTGEAVWERVHGAEVFPYLFERNRPLGEIFDRAMTSFSGATIPAILEAYNFSEAQTVADIAGGHGHLLAAVLNRHPHLNGILFDAPIVLENAVQLVENEKVHKKTQFVAGDFFDEVPVRADVYLVKHIIHDWSDARAIKILKNIRTAMPDNAKVLICEMVISAGNEPDFGKILDMEMMVSPGGIERTAEEYLALLAASGLKLVRIIPTKSPISIIEAVKS